MNRDHMRADREMLANELEELFILWRTEKWWWTRASIGHVILVKCYFRLSTIIAALRAGEGK